jgi:hypothetical protein
MAGSHYQRHRFLMLCIFTVTSSIAGDVRGLV